MNNQLELAKLYKIDMSNIIKFYGKKFAVEFINSLIKKDSTSVELIYPKSVKSDQDRNIYLDHVIETGIQFKEYSENFSKEDEPCKLPLWEVYCIGYKFIVINSDKKKRAK